jgi:hypothetical protein
MYLVLDIRGDIRKVKNTLSYDSTPAYVFMSCCKSEPRAIILCSHYAVRCISIYSQENKSD